MKEDIYGFLCLPTVGEILNFYVTTFKVFQLQRIFLLIILLSKFIRRSHKCFLDQLIVCPCFYFRFQFINSLKTRSCDYILCGYFSLFNLILEMEINIHMPGTDRCLLTHTCIFTRGYFLNDANVIISGDKETNT